MLSAPSPRRFITAANSAADAGRGQITFSRFTAAVFGDVSMQLRPAREFNLTTTRTSKSDEGSSRVC